MENDKINPAEKSCIGDNNKTNTKENDIEESPSYLSPKHLENNKTTVITEALIEDAENPHTPE